jgi:hypothetical protein
MSFFDRFRRNKSAKKKSVNEYSPRHCFVLCKTADSVDTGRASRAVEKIFGKSFSIDCSDPNILIVQRGKETVGFLAHMPAPIPGQEAESNAEGNFLWPEGKQEAGLHQSHVIATTVGGDERPAIEAAIEVSKLALVALQAFDGLGVYWGNASVCNSREVFETFCKGMSHEQLPIPVWLRFQFISESEDEIGIYTLGMQQFGLMEIEVDRCSMEPGELFEFVSNIAHYLVQSGPVIADGNTVGSDADEQIPVKHLPSMIDDTKTVYKILFD